MKDTTDGLNGAMIEEWFEGEGRGVAVCFGMDGSNSDLVDFYHLTVDLEDEQKELFETSDDGVSKLWITSLERRQALRLAKRMVALLETE